MTLTVCVPDHVPGDPTTHDVFWEEKKYLSVLMRKQLRKSGSHKLYFSLRPKDVEYKETESRGSNRSVFSPVRWRRCNNALEGIEMVQESGCLFYGRWQQKVQLWRGSWAARTSPTLLCCSQCERVKVSACCVSLKASGTYFIKRQEKTKRRVKFAGWFEENTAIQAKLACCISAAVFLSLPPGTQQERSKVLMKCKMLHKQVMTRFDAEWKSRNVFI